MTKQCLERCSLVPTFLPKSVRRQAFASREKISTTKVLQELIIKHDQELEERSVGSPGAARHSAPTGGSSRDHFDLSPQSPASTILPHNLAMGRTT